jgi:exosortase/archaeosortase family protein
VTGIFQFSNSGKRQTWVWVFVALGVYWLALIHQLGAQWSIYEQYSYGWAVPLLCVFLVWQRMQESHLRPPTSEAPSSIFYFLFVACALLYAPTRFFQEANPIWRLTIWLWAMEVIVFTLVLLHFALRTSHSALRAGEKVAAGRMRCGPQGHGEVTAPPSAFRLSDFVFPVAFFLVAVPWPSGIENFLVQTLTRLNVSATVEALGWLGIPALQHANVIEVATGNVGINDACSGIRSFQATLMISLFFGELYSLNVARRAICVLAGFALSFLFNIARTTLLAWVAAEKGVAATASWHDPAGVAILVACFLTLWLAAMWLCGKNRRQKAEVGSRKMEIRGTSPQPSPQRGEGGLLSTISPQLSTVRWLAIALLAWFVLVEAGVECWYRAHERAVAVNNQWTVNAAGLGSDFAKVEIPPEISSQFRSDESLEGRWRDDTGNAWQLYYFRWFPNHRLNKRVAIQLAKTHGPEICLPAIGMTMKADLGVIMVPVGDRQFAFRQYVFLAGEHPLHVFYAIYEDPGGSAVLANRRKDTASRIAAALAGSRNDGQRFLEMVAAGPENPEQAQSALRAELEKLIVSKQ